MPPRCIFISKTAIIGYNMQLKTATISGFAIGKFNHTEQLSECHSISKKPCAGWAKLPCVRMQTEQQTVSRDAAAGKRSGFVSGNSYQ